MKIEFYDDTNNLIIKNTDRFFINENAIVIEDTGSYEYYLEYRKNYTFKIK